RPERVIPAPMVVTAAGVLVNRVDPRRPVPGPWAAILGVLRWLLPIGSERGIPDRHPENRRPAQRPVRVAAAIGRPERGHEQLVRGWPAGDDREARKLARPRR